MALDRTRHKAAIVIMAKAPQPGQVKTRLRPFLSDGQCAAIAACFLKDTVASALTVTDEVFVAYQPTGARDAIAGICGDPVTLVEQVGNDLGERLQAIVNDVYNKNPGPVVVIGTDSPTLPRSILGMAASNLIDPSVDLVLGPTEDGGYYLIGFGEPESGVFQDIDWSSAEVYQQTHYRARLAGLTKVVELPVWYDIDVPADLLRLYRDAGSMTGERRSTFPETYGWLCNNAALFE